MNIAYPQILDDYVDNLHSDDFLDNMVSRYNAYDNTTNMNNINKANEDFSKYLNKNQLSNTFNQPLVKVIGHNRRLSPSKDIVDSATLQRTFRDKVKKYDTMSKKMDMKKFEKRNY